MLAHHSKAARTLLKVTLSLAVSFTGIDPAAAQPSTTGTIAGVVVARQSGQPIAGAAVRIVGTGLTARSNGAGRFQIDRVPVGSVTVGVQAAGFVDGVARPANIPANGTAHVTIELDATPNFLERVQVTATKTPLSLGDVAAQTDIVDRATIDQRGDQTLTQAVEHVPGAVVSTQLGIFESVMLRGMPRGDPEFTNTLLLIDGIPQTTSANASRVVALTIDEASSIEIVRGPGSALYGRTAIGGSINLRTADPTPDRQFTFDLTGGQLGTFKGIARASGPITDRGGFLVSIGRARNGGFYQTKTGGDFTDETTSVFGKVTFVPDAKSFASVTFNHVVSDNSTPTNEPIVDGELLHVIDARFDRLTNFNIPGPNYHQGEDRLAVNYTRQFTPWARAVEVFGYRGVNQQFIDDGDFIGSPFDLESHTVEQYPFNQDLKEHIAYQELRAEFTPRLGRLKHTLTTGGSYEWNSGSVATDFIFTDPDNEGIPIDYLNPVIPPASEWSHDVQPTRHYHLGIAALFAQYIVEPTSRWVLTAGGRYDRLSLDNAPEGSAKISSTFDAFSPKASATFKVFGADGGASTLNLYGAYAQAFLPPRRPSSLTPANVVLNLQPENIDNIEGGVKGSLLGGRVSFDGAYFWMREDGVVLTRRQGPFFLPTSAGQQRYKGLETGLHVTVTPKIAAYMNAAFYRNRFGEFVIQSAEGDAALTGNRLPISPDYVVNWGATFAPAASVDATIDVKHMSSVLADRDNTFTIDPYTLVDAAITWRRAPVRLTLSGHNLFNQQYYWNADGETADPGHPRRVLLTTSFLFK